MKCFEQLSRLFILLSFTILVAGCGGSSSQAILPIGELTAEQKAAVKAEDARVDEEESQGKMNKSKKRSRAER